MKNLVPFSASLINDCSITFIYILIYSSFDEKQSKIYFVCLKDVDYSVFSAVKNIKINPSLTYTVLYLNSCLFF